MQINSLKILMWNLILVTRQLEVERWEVIASFTRRKDLGAGKVTSKAILHDRIKSKVEKCSQDVTAGQLPRKAATFQEFKQAPTHLRERENTFYYLEYNRK